MGSKGRRMYKNSAKMTTWTKMMQLSCRMLLDFDSVHTALAMLVDMTVTQNVTVTIRIVSHEPVFLVTVLIARVHMYTTSRPAHEYSTSRPVLLFSSFCGFWDTLIQIFYFKYILMKISNFRGDLTDVSGKRSTDLGQ